jgi:hypothetical protein
MQKVHVPAPLSFNNVNKNVKNMQEEIWKDIPNYEGHYQVSNLGRVKSLWNGKERILKAGISIHGYLFVILCIKNSTKNIKVHQLVVMGFLNHTPNGHTLVVDHINNVKTDNRLENLQVISHRENSSKDKKGKSKYTGVSWNKAINKWVAHIYINMALKYLGSFNCETAAHLAYQNTLKQSKSVINN